MYRFWETIIRPVLELADARHIVEIGIGEGKNTENILQFCKKHGGFLHAIDPSPSTALTQWEIEYAEIFEFQSKKSLDALPLLSSCDAVLIDGDHNWYTVYHELLLLQKKIGQSGFPPVMFLHDTGWPYAHRDLYYDPSDIPPAYRKPYAKKGVRLDGALGKINPSHCNAIEEGGSQNGVHAAVEDFMKKSEQEMLCIHIPGFHGLTIIVSKQLLAKNTRLKDFCMSLKCTGNYLAYMESLEMDRVREMLTRGYFENQCNDVLHQAQVAENLAKAFEEKWEEAERDLERMKHAHIALEENIHHLSIKEQTLERIMHSKSWRFTHPIRQAEYFLRSVFKKNKDSKPKKNIEQPQTFNPENISDEDYTKWQQMHWLSPQRVASSRRAANELSSTPTISIIVTLYNSDEIFLRKALNSVVEQTYLHWELILVDDGSSSPLPEKIAKEFAEVFPHKIRFKRLHIRGGISTATNVGASLATGEYVAFLDHDDVLELDALEKVASFLQNAVVPLDALYTDDDLMDENGWRYAPAFKPDWSPELLLSFCYVGHWKIIRRTLFQELDGYRTAFDGAQDYDFFLRLSEKTQRIAHIPEILYHWRNIPQSASKNPISLERGRLAVQEALIRRGAPASAEYAEGAEAGGLGIYRIAFTPPPETPVTIIIPTKGKGDLLQRCIQSIQKTTSAVPFTFLIVDNGISNLATMKFLHKQSLRVININTPEFNFSRLINAAAEKAPTELLLFLNDDTEIVTPTWLEEMVGVLLLDKHIGAVGVKLLYPDRTVQHGGVSLLGNTASHTNKHIPGNAWGYRYSNRVLRNCAAVTAACMLTRKTCFQEVGGLDEECFPVGYNDVDYCLKIREKGYRTAWTPHAVLYHYESATRPKYCPHDRSHLALLKKWPMLMQNDPYVNPHFSRKSERFVLSADV